jgi:FkbM family methyltransferase
MTINGEVRLIRDLSPLNFEVVFDVGANKGDYAVEVMRWHPNARVYCFEVSPANLTSLKARLAHDPRAVLVDKGLLEATGEIAVKEYSDGTLNTVMAESWHHSAFHEVFAAVISGDQFCLENAIDAIDFLKIDTEGAEDRVLTGFSRMLVDRRIRFVQFEYGYANAYTKFLMNDFRSLFERYGYVVGRIRSQKVDFTDEGVRANDFHRAPNFLAVREDMTRHVQ